MSTFEKSMTDDLESSLMQYLDGSLPQAQRLALEKQLAQDPQLQMLLQQHRKLNDLLQAPASLPEVQWDALARRIASAVAAQPPPVRSYKLQDYALPRAWVGAAALAACALIAATVLFHLNWGTPNHVAVSQQPNTAIAEASVTGPQVETAAGSAVAEVALGPTPAQAALWHDVSGVVIQPSHVYIASAESIVDHTVH